MPTPTDSIFQFSPSPAGGTGVDESTGAAPRATLGPVLHLALRALACAVACVALTGVVDRAGDLVPAPESGDAPVDTVTAFEPMAAVRTPVDDDGVPSRMGDTVRVAGRAVSEAGRLGPERHVYVQDGAYGLALDLPATGPNVRRGDSVQAVGVVDQHYGQTTLRVLDYAVPGGDRRVPRPLVVPLDSARGERYEGMLVHLHGRVDNVGSNDGGQYLLLSVPGGGDVLSVFVENRNLGRISLERFEVGDRVEVTGVLTQHDYSAPYTSYYEVLPRSSDDVARASVPARHYRNVAIVIAVVVLIAVLIIVCLRKEVRRRTQQVAESQARFRRLAEATFEGIVVHRDGEIQDVNRALTEMTGYDREELVGEDALQFLTDATRDIVREKVESQHEEPYEAVIERKNGSTFPAEIEAKTVENGSDNFRIAAIRDVTKRKQDEAELLLAKEEAEKVAQLKSSLLNNMSHELRTPITSIIGYAELIMDEPPETHEAFARHIRDSGRRLSDTLQSVLDMAQIEAGTLDLRVTDVDVTTVAQEVVNEHRQAARKKDVALITECDADCHLRTDRTLVYRVLTNLVHNAVKFTEHGAVTIRLESTDIGVQMTVEDTGIGIGEDFQPHVFEPFKQESHGRTRDYDGTGLGLAITKHMVDLLGGTISVESQKDVGSTFRVDLPTVLSHNDTAVTGEELVGTPGEGEESAVRDE